MLVIYCQPERTVQARLLFCAYTTHVLYILRTKYGLIWSRSICLSERGTNALFCFTPGPLPHFHANFSLTDETAEIAISAAALAARVTLLIYSATPRTRVTEARLHQNGARHEFHAPQ